MYADKILPLWIWDLGLFLWPFKQQVPCWVIFVFTVLGSCLADGLSGGQVLLRCVVDLLLSDGWVCAGQQVDMSQQSHTLTPLLLTALHYRWFLPVIPQPRWACSPFSSSWLFLHQDSHPQQPQDFSMGDMIFFLVGLGEVSQWGDCIIAVVFLTPAV